MILEQERSHLVQFHSPWIRLGSCSNITDVSGIYFCNGTNLTTFVPSAITMSGNFIQGSSNTLNLPPATVGQYSHAEGADNTVSAIISHAEGSGNTITTGGAAPSQGQSRGRLRKYNREHSYILPRGRTRVIM